MQIYQSPHKQKTPRMWGWHKIFYAYFSGTGGMPPKLIFKPILILFELSSAIINSRSRAILSVIS